jgi:hypothetical protein
MKKTYGTPMIIASDVTRETLNGATVTTIEVLPKFRTPALGFGL